MQGIENELDALMEDMSRVYYSAMAINAASVSEERDVQIQSGLGKMRTLGVSLKAKDKGDVYTNIQEAVLAFVRTVRGPTPTQRSVALIV